MNARKPLSLAGIVLAVSAALIAGCGGGAVSHGGVPPGGGSAGGGQQNLATATLRIVIPQKTTNGRRRPAYISPSTTQLAWTLDGAQQTPVSLVPSMNSDCMGSGSSTVCTVPFYVAPGTHSFVFTLEDANNTALSTGTATNVSLVAGTANTLNLTLGGIPSGVTVSSSNTNFVQSNSVFTMYGTGSVTLAINVTDADGNTIVGNGAPVLTAAIAAASPIPSPSPAATLVAGTGNTWTLTSSFAPTSPTLGTAAVLTVQASPSPGASIAPLNARFSLLFYVPRIYVTQSGNGKVTSYDEQGNAASTTITGLNAPSSIVFGANTSTASPLPSPYLYVGNVVYPTPTAMPTASDTAGPTPSPYGVYVPYNVDGTTPASVSAFTSPGVPVGVSFDTKTNVFYALNSLGTSLLSYPPAGGSPTTLVASIASPTGIAFDARTYDIYIATATGVTAYTEAGIADPSVGAFTSTSGPSAIAYIAGSSASTDQIAVLNKTGSSVGLYAASGGAPLSSFSVIASPTAMLYDPYTQWIYVANSSSIKAYNKAGVVQSVTGSWPNLSSPSGLTVVL